jgi:peptidoglycan/LPS O-acetylase OafA/YrhL
VWAAVAVAVFLHVLVARHATAGMSWWLAGHAQPLSLKAVGDAATLKLPEQFSVFTALWSLRWEMVFSVLMPLYAWAAPRGRRLPILLIVVPLVPILLAGQRAPVAYLPCFFLGTALAARLDLISTAQRQLKRRPIRLLARATVLFALTAQAPLGTGQLAAHVGPVLTALGATGAVVLALADPGLRRKLHLPAVRWLGTRSFSLYLVHEPLLVTTAYLLHGALTLWILALIALPVIALATEAFYRVIEQPAHRLARDLGQRLTRESRVNRRHSPTPAELAGFTPPPRARA